MQEIDPSNIIVIDESGSNLGEANEYARAENGDRAKASKPHDCGERYSILGAISTSAIIAVRYISGAVDGDVFTAFVKELTNKLKSGQYVVMDNVNFHKKEIIKTLIENVGAKVAFLPPYSPDLSPIENMWSKIKEIIRQIKPRSAEEFHNALGEACYSIESSDLEGWYEYCGYNVLT